MAGRKRRSGRALGVELDWALAKYPLKIRLTHRALNMKQGYKLNVVIFLVTEENFKIRLD
ncbi:unnamed protein product [Sphenostylis stenocarpa]|uniref:Uncharacterized protein n=1 Tax=Sphenostylis stenocarpa TaxID=92480 RepID=A0AA86SMS5_9FABA|nr:unnamed protein product [Sphenostylis stenocarpa]